MIEVSFKEESTRDPEKPPKLLIDHNKTITLWSGGNFACVLHSDHFPMGTRLQLQGREWREFRGEITIKADVPRAFAGPDSVE